MTFSVGDAAGEIRSKDPVRITFPANIDHADAQGHFLLEPPINGALSWQDNTLLFTPQQPWPTAALVRVHVQAPATSSGATQMVDWSFVSPPAFTISEVSPAPSTNYVPRNAVINLVFTRALAAGTVAPNVVIQPAVAGAWQQNGRMATFVPNQPLAYLTTYNVTVTGAIQDLDGDKLGVGKVFEFQTMPTPGRVAQVVINSGSYAVFIPADRPPQLAFTTTGIGSVHLAIYRAPTIQAFIAAFKTTSTDSLDTPPATFVKVSEADVVLDASTQDTQLVTIPGIAGAGAYYLQETAASSQLTGQFLVMSDRGVILQQASDGIAAWVTSLKDGKPQANVPMRVYSADSGASLGSGATTSDGLFRQSLSPEVHDSYQSTPNVVVVAGTDAAFTVAATSWEFYASGYTNVPDPYQVYAYTDRPIYRPGDTVHMRGIVRVAKSTSYTVSTDIPITVKVLADGFQELFSKAVHLDAAGTFAIDIPLASTTAGGYEGVQIDLGGTAAKPAQTNYPTSFQIASYRKPQYAVSVTTPPQPFVNGDTVPVTVSARYFYGQPVKNGTVSLRVTRTNYWEPGSTSVVQQDPEIAEEGNYNSSNEGIDVQTITGVLDDQGVATLRVPTDISNLEQSQLFGFDATVTDAAHDPVTGRTSAVIHRGHLQLYVVPTAYATNTSTPVQTAITVQDVSGKEQPGAAVNCDVFQQTYAASQVGSPKGALLTYHLVEVLAYKAFVQTGADGSAQTALWFTRPSGYRLHCTTTDSAGNVTSRDTYFWSQAGTGAIGPYAAAGDSITLGADKASYAVGDTAHLQVYAPVSNVTALVTLARGTILSQRLITLTGNSSTLDIPITADAVPDESVTLVVQSNDHLYLGQVSLRVPATQQYLNLTLTADKASYQPGDKAAITLKATDARGQPVQGNFSIGVVDEAIYTLYPNTDASIKWAFYSPKPDLVLTAGSTQAVPAKGPMGGRGGGGGGGSASNVRSDFPDTAYWNANVQTTQDGTAQVSFTLPDSLTTWRITAIGATNATQVGYTQSDVLSAKPFHLRPTLPRFVTSGDSVNLGAIVANDGASAVDATVTINASNVQVASAVTQTVHIAAKSSTPVNWTAKVGAAGTTAITLQAKAGDLSDDVQITLPILPSGSSQSVSHAGQLTGGSVDQTLDVPQEALPGTATVDIAITPSLLAGAQLALGYLYATPRTDAETAVSELLPGILARDLYTKANLPQPTQQLPTDFNEQAANEIIRINALKHQDGGWNWWSYDQTDPYMTAYVVIGLSEAKRLGYAVNQPNIDGGVRIVRERLSDAQLGLGTKAYLLYALAVAGKPQPNDSAIVQSLLQQTSSMAYYGDAYLAQALMLNGDTADAQKVLAVLAAAVTQTDSTASWHEQITDLPPLRGSVIYSTAAALSAYAMIAPKDPLALKAARYLLAARVGSGWQSTHDAAMATAALLRYLAAHGDLQADQQYQVIWNGQTLKSVQVAMGTETALPLTLTIPADQVKLHNTVTIKSSGATPLFWSLALNYRTALAGATGKELQVQRSYTTPTGAPITGPVAIGTVVQVHVTVTAAVPLNYVQVTDWLPAGLEPIDPRLATSQTVASGNNQTPLPYDNIDLRDAATVFSITNFPAGKRDLTYFARASTAGTFAAPSAQAQLVYDPAIQGSSAGNIELQVTP